MKKIIFAALSVLMIFSLIGCGEHIDYTENPVLGAGAVPGAFNGWDNTTAWTTVDDDKCVYTYEFKADAAEVEWKAITIAGDWNSGAYINAVVKPDGNPVKLSFDDKTGGGTNASITELTKGNSYKLTVYSEDGAVFAKVEDLGAAAAAPVPYYLDGLFLVGSVFEGGWSIAAEDLIWGASLDEKTGIVTYTKDIKATAASGEMGINDSAWGNKQLGKGVIITAGEDYKVLDGDEGSNFNVSGLKVGGAYRVYIQTTPEKAVSVKIEEICTLTFKFKITGLTEGMEAWLNGSVWGSGWPCGWPLTAWGTPGNGLTVSDAAVADESGVAVFGDKWNMTTVAKPGDSLKYQVKFVASDDSWATTKYDNANIDISIDVEGDATYLITVNAADNTATVTKE